MKRLTKSTIATLSAGSLVTLLCSCTTNHLVYVQEATLGLNISAGSEGTNKFSLGYDRDIYAIVPKKGNDDQGGESDAMSLFSVNRSVITDLRDISVSEFVATGTPATKIATDANKVNSLRTKVYGN